MPDLKFWKPETALAVALARARDYPERAREASREVSPDIAM